MAGSTTRATSVPPGGVALSFSADVRRRWHTHRTAPVRIALLFAFVEGTARTAAYHGTQLHFIE